ncbi:interleukin-10 [Stegostoma tigrinum]|uniref:interleukin-10 n=1 Tax=Stegostoma tigrinum TaxID=3053191 RepID=UPI002870339C|nr:interleukin-10 [Stegostoma tigrinum]
MKCVTVILYTVISIQCCYCRLEQSGDNCFSHAVFPAHLKELRSSYRKIRTYFQRKDDNLHITLLGGRLHHGFKGREGCQFLKEMLNFYLRKVIPAAKTHQQLIDNNISKIGNTLSELQENVQNCHKTFNCDVCDCRPSANIQNINGVYKKLQDKGVYKAIGELNIFFDWLQKYITMKMK